MVPEAEDPDARASGLSHERGIRAPAFGELEAKEVRDLAIIALEVFAGGVLRALGEAGLAVELLEVHVRWRDRHEWAVVRDPHEQIGMLLAPYDDAGGTKR